jgi:hypothetical protein
VIGEVEIDRAALCQGFIECDNDTAYKPTLTARPTLCPRVKHTINFDGLDNFSFMQLGSTSSGVGATDIGLMTLGHEQQERGRGGGLTKSAQELRKAHINIGEA